MTNKYSNSIQLSLLVCRQFFGTDDVFAAFDKMFEEMGAGFDFGGDDFC